MKRVLMVRDNPASVEADLAGRQLPCPACEGALRPWGFARRRFVRGSRGGRWLRPRRALCASCWATHVLLPTSALLRRAALAELIGAALLAKAAEGSGHRTIAARLGVPPATVRGWLRRFAAKAEEIRGLATSLAYRADPNLGAIEPRGSAMEDAVVSAFTETRR